MGALRAALIVIGITVPPLLGVTLAGAPLAPYLELPPLTRYVRHAGFSVPVFLAAALLALALLAPLVTGLYRAWRLRRPRPPALRPYPWWGWLGLLLLISTWILAWTRLPWMEALQRHTFTPLWLGYILAMNGLAYRRHGRSLLTHETPRFLLLFALSALFWWFFEYLNRFVQNWYYLGVEDLSALEYVAFASLSFSTVLPAVLSTLAWLQLHPALNEAFRGRRWALPRLRIRPGWVLATALLLEIGIGLYPDLMFPFVWVAPLLVVLAAGKLTRQTGPFPGVTSGDLRPIALPALAGLICGLLWELWNFRSLAHWEYAIPYVQRLHLFEMPIVGYAGYLPFGLECLAAATVLGGLRWTWPQGRDP